MLNLQESNGLNLAFTSGAIAGGTTTGTFKTVSSITYAINGTFATAKGATDNLVFSASNTLAAGTATLFGLWLDASGNVTTTQGPTVGSSDDCPVPPMSNGKVMFGLIKIVNLTNPFILNTTAVGATGVTTTYFNTCGMVGASQ